MPERMRSMPGGKRAERNMLIGAIYINNIGKHNVLSHHVRARKAEYDNFDAPVLLRLIDATRVRHEFGIPRSLVHLLFLHVREGWSLGVDIGGRTRRWTHDTPDAEGGFVLHPLDGRRGEALSRGTAGSRQDAVFSDRFLTCATLTIGMIRHKGDARWSNFMSIHILMYTTLMT